MHPLPSTLCWLLVDIPLLTEQSGTSDWLRKAESPVRENCSDGVGQRERWYVVETVGAEVTDDESCLTVCGCKLRKFSSRFAEGVSDGAGHQWH